MVKRVQVTDPHSGATLRVAEGSPQAKAWGGSAAGKSEPKKQAPKQAPKSEPAETEGG